MASSLHVSRPTVSAALNYLLDSGIVVYRQCSGTRVVSHPDVSESTDYRPTFTSSVLAPTVVNLAAAVPFDASHLPSLTVSSADLLTVVPDHGVAPFGLDALREAAAKRVSDVG